MPKFPDKKSRPWIPKRNRDNKGITPTSYSDKEYSAFYHTKQWKSIRNYYIQMNPLCELCDMEGYTIQGQCVDHITPRRLGGSDTNLSNLQTLCNSCHASKTGKESRVIVDKYKKNKKK
tara:strand:+ start:1649 stop:2005 length:357 start_codon:yes stop_codon:yes gene_type:complete